jgi:hypothetical protein
LCACPSARGRAHAHQRRRRRARLNLALELGELLDLLGLLRPARRPLGPAHGPQELARVVAVDVDHLLADQLVEPLLEPATRHARHELQVGARQRHARGHPQRQQPMLEFVARHER